MNRPRLSGSPGQKLAGPHDIAHGLGASAHRRIGASAHRRIGASAHRRIGASAHRRIGASLYTRRLAPLNNSLCDAALTPGHGRGCSSPYDGALEGCSVPNSFNAASISLPCQQPLAATASWIITVFLPQAPDGYKIVRRTPIGELIMLADRFRPVKGPSSVWRAEDRSVGGSGGSAEHDRRHFHDHGIFAGSRQARVFVRRCAGAVSLCRTVAAGSAGRGCRRRHGEVHPPSPARRGPCPEPGSSPRQGRKHPPQRLAVHRPVDDHPRPVRQRDLHPSRHRFGTRTRTRRRRRFSPTEGPPKG